LVNVKAVLFRVALEQLCLSHDVVLGFFFFLLVDEVGTGLRLGT
jgi:hypothetical protein